MLRTGTWYLFPTVTRHAVNRFNCLPLVAIHEYAIQPFGRSGVAGAVIVSPLVDLETITRMIQVVVCACARRKSNTAPLPTSIVIGHGV